MGAAEVVRDVGFGDFDGVGGAGAFAVGGGEFVRR